jgi:hypothetical protein
MGTAPESIQIDGHEARRDYQAEQGGVSRSKGSGWPMEPCVASGVNVSQAGELRKFFKKHNFACEVSSGGNPVYTSPGHQKRALALRGLHNKASY